MVVAATGIGLLPRVVVEPLLAVVAMVFVVVVVAVAVVWVRTSWPSDSTHQVWMQL